MVVWFQVYHAKFFKICNRQKAVKEAFCFTKLIPNPTLSTFNMLMSVCASSQDSDGESIKCWHPFAFVKHSTRTDYFLF